VDHGAETPSERLELGKAPEASITLRTVMRGDRFTVEIEDDGRGVDWDRVREKAEAQGLPCQTKEDVAMALFTDGLSTREDVTDLSGRGVGMGALKAATEALGGVINVESTQGAGTVIAMSFPSGAVMSVASGRSGRSLPPRAA
jgi:two-component system chemotaxis sensor kinase CheA